jgi:hypothetical protein
MSESYSESNAVPEETLSAMAEATVEIFDNDDYVADQGLLQGTFRVIDWRPTKHSRTSLQGFGRCLPLRLPILTR